MSGNYVYVLGSRTDPNLCKIGSGDYRARCYNLNRTEWGGPSGCDLFVAHVIGCGDRSEAFTLERMTRHHFNFARVRIDGRKEREFFRVPPKEVAAFLSTTTPEQERENLARYVCYLEGRLEEAMQIAERDTARRDIEFHDRCRRLKTAEQRAVESEARLAKLEAAAAQAELEARDIIATLEQTIRDLKGETDNSPSPIPTDAFATIH